MPSVYSSLLRHTAVYSVGQLLARTGSVLLLPVYTRYLTPSDYGTIAILDLVSALLVIVFGFGLATAAQRYHFDIEDERARSRMWSATLLLVAVPWTAPLALLWWCREPLALLTHGSDAVGVGDLYSLVLPMVWCTALNQAADGYLRIRKHSATSVLLDLTGLGFNIALNLFLLVVAGMGVTGVLLGNLIATGSTAVGRAVVVLREIDWARPAMAAVPSILRFGAPLVVGALLATAMHQVDRYFLRVFRDLEEVGIYSLAYMLAQGMASLLMVPFAAAWEAVRYEIALQPDAPAIYARVFHGFVSALALMSFALALFADEILAVLAPISYEPAARLVPILSLAYLAFSMHLHFSVPALLHKVPQRTTVVFAAGVGVNVLANLALIPSLGAYGAALASLASYSAFSAIGLWRYSRLERYPYPFAACGATIGGMVAAFAVTQWLTRDMAVAATVLVKSSVWVAAALLLAGTLRDEMAILTGAALDESSTAAIERR